MRYLHDASENMRATSIGLVLLLAGAGASPAFAEDASSAPASASAAASGQTDLARLDNAHCDAYRASSMAVRSPRDLGSVILRLEISPQGEVVSSEIAEHTTSRFFAHVVQENFSKCRFSPAHENGVAVPGHAVRLRLVFGDQVRGKVNNAECPPPQSRETPPLTGEMLATKLRIRFLPTGHVAGIEVLQSSGLPALDEAAVEAYRQCHFDPSASGQPAFEEEWVTTVNWSS